MYYKSKLKNKNIYNSKKPHRINKDKFGKRERRYYLTDVFFRAVATGFFIFSILLNIVLIITILFMGISQRSKVSFQGKEILYSKEYVKGGSGSANSFVIIDVNGIISEEEKSSFYGLTSREGMVEGIKNRLSIIKKSPDVKGIILLVNSPGGTVTASDMIYHEIEEFKKKHSIPVITYIKDIGASGAYYIASASDYIFAYPTAITGSIGVIMYNFNFKNLMEKYGVKYVVIKSGKHKDLMSPFKDVDPDEVKWMQGIVDELLGRFIGVVKLNRKNLSLQNIKSLADGRIFTANMAKKVGLIDDVGYFDDALKYLEKLTGVTSYSVYRYVREKKLSGLLGFLEKIGRFFGKKSPLPILSKNSYGRYSNNGIETYYLMDSGYRNGINVELY